MLDGLRESWETPLARPRASLSPAILWIGLFYAACVIIGAVGWIVIGLLG